jgi:hypothetical protein
MLYTVIDAATGRSRNAHRDHRREDRGQRSVSRVVTRSFDREACCAAADVRVVWLLAQAMGRESETTTTEHHAGRAAVAIGAIDRVATMVH